MIYLRKDEPIFVWSTLDPGVEIMKCPSYTVGVCPVRIYLTDGREVVWIPANVKLIIIHLIYVNFITHAKIQNP